MNEKEKKSKKVVVNKRTIKFLPEEVYYALKQAYPDQPWAEGETLTAVTGGELVGIELVSERDSLVKP